MTTKVKKKIGFIGYILRFLNWILIFALLISYCAQWISPEHLWPIAFFGLTYPILAILNIIFVLYWLYKKRKFALFPLIALLIGIPVMTRFIQFGNSAQNTETKKSFKIVSYNVHVLDQYHSKFKNQNAKEKIFEFLKNQDADIYCLQEFFNKENNNKASNIELIKKKLGTPYSYFQRYTPRSRYLYNVILSKKPIQNSGKIVEDQRNRICGIFSDINICNRIIRVYSVHLQSFQISNEAEILNFDYNLKTAEGKEAAKQKSIKMAKKFKTAFSARSHQISSLKKHMETNKLPIVLCGDFNDTPSSYSYGQLTDKLIDSFKENGKGFGTTYNGPYPSFRIDYILHDPKLTNIQFNTYKFPYSDHYPISAVFSFLD